MSESDRNAKPLRIAVNALYLLPGQVGGTEIYLRSLLEAIAGTDTQNRYLIYINEETAGDPPSTPSPRFELVRCGIRASSRPLRLAWEQTVFPVRLWRDRIDVLFNPGFTAPALFTPSVTVFHDLQHKRHPEFFRWFDLPFWNFFLWLAVVRSRRLIAVSQATADDLERYYPGSGERTVTIPHGVDLKMYGIGGRRALQAAPPATGAPFILTVSTLHPHKNLERLMEAFRIFLETHPGFRLVVAGMKGFATWELEARRSALGLATAVTFTGWIPREELYGLFEKAEAYIAPSEFEGFGMPVVEALAAGLPTACSDIAPLNVITGTAAVHFDPQSVSEIVAALEKITGDAAFRAAAGIAGPAQARTMDWEQTARRTTETLARACRRSL